MLKKNAMVILLTLPISKTKMLFSLFKNLTQGLLSITLIGFFLVALFYPFEIKYTQSLEYLNPNFKHIVKYRAYYRLLDFNKIIIRDLIFNNSKHIVFNNLSQLVLSFDVVKLLTNNKLHITQICFVNTHFKNINVFLNNYNLVNCSLNYGMVKFNNLNLNKNFVGAKYTDCFNNKLNFFNWGAINANITNLKFLNLMFFKYFKLINKNNFLIIKNLQPFVAGNIKVINYNSLQGKNNIQINTKVCLNNNCYNLLIDGLKLNLPNKKQYFKTLLLQHICNLDWVIKINKGSLWIINNNKVNNANLQKVMAFNVNVFGTWQVKNFNNWLDLFNLTQLSINNKPYRAHIKGGFGYNWHTQQANFVPIKGCLMFDKFNINFNYNNWSLNLKNININHMFIYQATCKIINKKYVHISGNMNVNFNTLMQYLQQILQFNKKFLQPLQCNSNVETTFNTTLLIKDFYTMMQNLELLWKSLWKNLTLDAKINNLNIQLPHSSLTNFSGNMVLNKTKLCFLGKASLGNVKNTPVSCQVYCGKNYNQVQIWGLQTLRDLIRFLPKYYGGFVKNYINISGKGNGVVKFFLTDVKNYSVVNFYVNKYNIMLKNTNFVINENINKKIFINIINNYNNNSSQLCLKSNKLNINAKLILQGQNLIIHLKNFCCTLGGCPQNFRAMLSCNLYNKTLCARIMAKIITLNHVFFDKLILMAQKMLINKLMVNKVCCMYNTQKLITTGFLWGFTINNRFKFLQPLFIKFFCLNNKQLINIYGWQVKNIINLLDLNTKLKQTLIQDHTCFYKIKLQHGKNNNHLLIGSLMIKNLYLYPKHWLNIILNCIAEGKGYYNLIALKQMQSDFVYRNNMVELNLGSIKTAQGEVCFEGSLFYDNLKICGHIKNNRVLVPFEIKGFWEKPSIWLGEEEKNAPNIINLR